MKLNTDNSSIPKQDTKKNQKNQRNQKTYNKISKEQLQDSEDDLINQLQFPLIQNKMQNRSNIVDNNRIRRSKIYKMNHGGKPILQVDQQLEVMTFVQNQVKKGKVLTMQMIADYAKKVCKNNYFLASAGWVKNFLKRYPRMKELYNKSRMMRSYISVPPIMKSTFAQRILNDDQKPKQQQLNWLQTQQKLLKRIRSQKNQNKQLSYINKQGKKLFLQSKGYVKNQQILKKEQMSYDQNIDYGQQDQQQLDDGSQLNQHQPYQQNLQSKEQKQQINLSRDVIKGNTKQQKKVQLSYQYQNEQTPGQVKKLNYKTYKIDKVPRGY